MTHSSDLSDFDFTSFWSESEYAREHYVKPYPTDEMVAEVEARLGVRLPKAYITLVRTQNGGYPIKTKHPTAQPTSWADDHLAIKAVLPIGLEGYALCGESGQKLWVEEWGYPDKGFVYIADCPSAGHDMVALDYRECGPSGEPSVVHIDQEGDYEITPVAETFADFIRGLHDRDVF